MANSEDIESRLEFLDLGAGEREALRRVSGTVLGALPMALGGLYRRIDQAPEARSFFTGQTHMAQAREHQLRHWKIITEAQFDEAYVQAVTTVGETHARIGLAPRWYIGGYAQVLASLVGALVSARWPSRNRLSRGVSSEQVSQELAALIKAALLDIDFALAVYLRAADEARQRAEAEVLKKERSEVVASVGAGMAALAAGDLSYRLPDDLPGEYAKLRDDFNTAAGTLENAMASVASAAANIGASSDEIAEASNDLSRRTEQQAAALEETAATLDEITAAVRTTAQGAQQTRQLVSETSSHAKSSGDVVARAIEAMVQIEASSRQISQIIGVIDEIAFQTNLLALNAGVEAARAGEAGRGFAVVASEVRALAQRSAEAAKEIKALIAASSAQVEGGVQLVGETGSALEAIVGKVAEINIAVLEIASSTEEQSAGLVQVNAAVNHMDQVVQQNAAMTEQASAATQALRQETASMVDLVARFRAGASTGAAGGQEAVAVGAEARRTGAVIALVSRNR